MGWCTSRTGPIVAVQAAGQAAPGRFQRRVPVVDTGGTLFPGLIELHNHLSYNALAAVVARCRRRFDTPGPVAQTTRTTGRLVSGPMTVIGKYKDAQGKYRAACPP